MVGPSTGGPIYTLAPFLCRPKTIMVGPSTGSPHLHTGPLPLQAENNYGGPQHWKPTSTHWPPSSAGRKSTMVGPIAGGPPKSTHWPPSSAGLKSSYWPLSFAGRNQPGLAPLCRPKSNTIGPTLQAEIAYCWPHSAGQNQLLVAPLCRPKIIYCYPNKAMAIQQYTPIGHQCQQYYPLLHSSDGLPSNPLSHPQNG